MLLASSQVSCAHTCDFVPGPILQGCSSDKSLATRQRFKISSGFETLFPASEAKVLLLLAPSKQCDKNQNFKIFATINPTCWPSLMKDMQTEQLLCWSGMTDTEHSTTSGSNEDE